MRPILSCLLTCLCYLPCAPAAAAPEQRLSFVASYQGILSGGVPVDIAGLDLHLKTHEPDVPKDPVTEAVQVTLSTQGYDVAEIFMPIRFCYRNRTHRESGATLESHWWSRIGSKASHGRLQFDEEGKKVTQTHTQRKIPASATNSTVLDPADLPTTPDLDIHELPFPEGARPMDQLSMMMWLRRQRLSSVDSLQLPVTNGKYLTGFRVVVEGHEDIDWNGAFTPSTRLRLEPQVNDDHDTSPTWLWISRDRKRLPLRFRSVRKYGRFDLTLQKQAAQEEPACLIPETAGLQLPE